ncbi:hypothetical protein VQH23_26575 (plasmid) [Pararoseomonas sp. SCSIO 73927]|uniref:hypothetical protein n=1 Tax=Pararoseomonas sp. SCSIO 73927 TaxID=3114537 RepID=UPI0030D5E21E
MSRSTHDLPFFRDEEVLRAVARQGDEGWTLNVEDEKGRIALTWRLDPGLLRDDPEAHLPDLLDMLTRAVMAYHILLIPRGERVYPPVTGVAEG